MKHNLYFCGHSLGLMPKTAELHVKEALEQWSHHQITAWNSANWLELPKQLGHKIAPLIGANANEVVVCDSTTVNLMKCLLSALELNNSRQIILTEKNNFPTDLYMADAVAKLRQVTVKTVVSENLIESMNEQVAVLMLTHVNYRTGAKYNMALINRLAKEKGILTVWDLSHSVGVMRLHCSQLDTDFAVGCTYKYLNGGPGSPSFIYVNQKHHQQASLLHGWMGHASPFSFSSHYQPGNGIASYLLGTPSILSMKAIEGALQSYENCDMQALEKRSHYLTSLLIEKCQQALPELECLSPTEPTQRGSHIAFTHPQAQAIAKALIERGVIIDYREPHLIRFGISPLYNTEQDIEQAVEILTPTCRDLSKVRQAAVRRE